MTGVVTGFLRQIAARLRLAPSSDVVHRSPQSLQRFLDRQSAYVTQRCVTEHLRLRLGIGWERISDDRDFRAAVERCRWEGFATVLAALAEIVLGRLRHRQGDRAAAGRVGEAAAAVLDTYAREQTVLDAAATAGTIRRRLEGSLDAAPRSADSIAEAAGTAMFRLLPIHTELDAGDREAFVNAVRFALCGVADRMDRELDLDAVAGGRS